MKKTAGGAASCEDRPERAAAHFAPLAILARSSFSWAAISGPKSSDSQSGRISRFDGPESSVHAPAARIAACGRLRNDGAPTRNHGAIMLSKIMQPNAELGMNGQMGLPHR